VFVRGTAEKPVYLHIDRERAELRDASEMWGLDTLKTEEAIRQTTSRDVHAACIGPAGEKRSLISGIVNDGARIAARCGLGAVMGAKKLKAVAARGKASPPLANKAAFDASSKGYRQLFRRRPARWTPLIHKFLHASGPLLRILRPKPTGGPTQMVIDNYRLYGTASGTALLVALDDTPIRNWTGSSVRDYPLAWAENLSDEAVTQHNIKPYACHSCPMACSAVIHLPDGGTGLRPEYETLAAFGPTVMNADLDTVIACNEICNLSGLDSISTGVAVAFAMECYERGWLPPDLVDELELPWGNGEAIVELTRRIAARQSGLGEWLADGVQRAAERLPAEVRGAAMHAGGQELAMHRGVYEPGVAVGYMVDPAPGRHSSTYSGISQNPNLARYLRLTGRQPGGRYDYKAKGAEMATTMAVLRAFDALGLCHFCLMIGEPPFMAWLRAATGWDVDDSEFLLIGKRIQALRHAFNARHGVTPDQVTLPGRERGDPPLDVGPLSGITMDVEAMTRSYYQTMGIDPRTGWPLPETARDLGWETLPDLPSAQQSGEEAT
jgi:aldehyde:ferredoxin oxidoreductase